jgi:enoyl-CoA hydratase/carnithine racemase
VSPSDILPRVDVERQAGALVVRLHNPGRANAVTHDMLRQLASLLNGPEVASAHAVLLAGSGDRHFSAGLDLAGVPADQRVEHLRAGEDLLFRASEAIAGCARPVIAVVNGAALGGGLELAMACDWRIAREDARVGMPAARIGVVYAPRGLRRAVQLMGAARARRLFLTGRPMRASEAYEVGLVDEITDPEGLWDLARRAAADVAACSPTAVAGTRAVIRAIERECDGSDVAAIADRWRARAFGGPDLREGLRAFSEGRAARFDLGAGGP